MTARRWALLTATLALLGGCGGDNGETPRPEPAGARLPLDYQRGYGGFVGGTARLRVEPDGRAQLDGGFPGEGCRPGRTAFQLAAGEVSQVRLLLARAADASPRIREEPAAEAPLVRITAPGIELRYLGFGTQPALVHPLVQVLDRIISDHCRRRGGP
jgi:hypothetical protein